MGLNVSHDAWHGPYSMFMRWREAVASAAGLPPLQEMKGFALYNPKPWPRDINPALKVLLTHSDCNGSIQVKHLFTLATVLEELAERLPRYEDDPEVRNDVKSGQPITRGTYDGVRNATLRFATACRAAHSLGERLRFG